MAVNKRGEAATPGRRADPAAGFLAPRPEPAAAPADPLRGAKERAVPRSEQLGAAALGSARRFVRASGSGRGVKVDNLVQVGHASDVGENTLLCAQVGLAGSSKIGRSVILTGQVGVAGHLEIGDRVVATAQTGIPSSVEADKIISGYPAIDNKLWLKCSAIFKRLPELLKRIEALEKGEL